MTMPRDPNEEHLQEAFRYLHEADWPASLRDLRMAAAKLALVQGMARRMANGHKPTRPDLSGPITARPTAPRPTSPRANGQTERRRRDDRQPAIDFKSLAAGERDDD